ncbi:flagellar basal body-associated protein FliL [Roseobacter sinensis]|uniref:Flagellar basal body-associated protein FliL n=1 Tax=Roseobacter sinensis TaxID=2931391 RepID=A0ABT3B8I0_9RHOB|nr:flagellar basal body-associated protein FliL [Roseobacter sp. WL0113]MCV3269887.1 flagellar basal body-associated protein FliL [Roseobacter sp. WL0113]
MKKLLPIVMLLVGSGAGVGAGIFLRPAPVEEEIAAVEGEKEAPEEAQDTKVESTDKPKDAGPSEGMEYVRLPNQFVVPLVDNERISALVVMSLSIEVTTGSAEEVLDLEPKLRDGFLRVLFDHASIGGFDGAFVNNENLDVVRRKLRDVAKGVMGSDVANDVLIFEVARQDY